jgi:hypothetical protein
MIFLGILGSNVPGLDKSKLKDSLANGMARRYKPGSSLPRHVEFQLQRSLVWKKKSGMLINKSKL